jgi:hypothetical protein
MKQRAAFGLCVLAWQAAAHVMSMSSGELTIEGSRARYELRMPLYEIGHVKQPERALLDHIRFGSARVVSRSCREDKANDAFLCSAEYAFSRPVEELEVECTFAAITVPNHVHLLHSTFGGKREESVFDASFTRTTLRFRDPGMGEVAVTESMAGLLRALGGPVQWLFLAALVLAARSRRELIVLGGAFVAGQCASVLVTPWTNWQPPPRFVEAAAALTVAYLAVEILLLPKAGTRWLVAGVMGLFHGLWLYLFIEATGYHAALVTGGAAVGEAAVLSALGWVAAKGWVRRAVPACASALLVFGLAWFWMRLKG